MANRFVSTAALVFGFMALTTTASNATVQPNPLFSDGAVLQQGISVPVWGAATEPEKVTVSFQNQTVSTFAHNGKWMVKLSPLRAGGPFTLKINDIRIKNVLVGEVWICSGQSNMQWSLSGAANGGEAVAACRDPRLRLFLERFAISKTPLDSASGTWKESAPDAAGEFSAVGYFFARELRRKLNVPIGMIQCAMGGSVAEAWTSRDALLGHPEYRHLLVDSDKAPIDGDHKRACLLYDGMLAPLAPYAIRGVIWYQGESNVGRADEYQTLFPTMIRSWRDQWGQGDFPFLFVQMAPSCHIATEPGESAWAEIREVQLETSKTCPNTAMVVITDYGKPDDVHPLQKEPVGHRLALAAQAVVYGKRAAYRGPMSDPC